MTSLWVLWRHQCIVMTKQKSPLLVTDALTMHLNVVKAITESSAVSLSFWRKPSDTDMQTTYAVSGSISGKVLDKLYWGSKWIFITVCWGAVGCEWGAASVYFGITYVWFVPSRFPVFDVKPQYQYHFCIFVESIIWRTHTKSSKKFMLV